MKLVSNRLAILCATLGLASFLNFSAQARVYSDASSDLFDSGLANLDITSVEVTNDASNITFAITTRSFFDWTKYLIGIRTAAASSSSTTGNAWNRPNTYAEGINFQIGSWVNDGGGLGFSQYISNVWTSAPGASIDLTQTGSRKVLWTIPLASLGLTLGDTFKFDVGTSGGGDNDPFVDVASRSDPSTSDWGTASTGGALLSYTTIDPNADGDLDNDNLQDNWEVTYFSDVRAQDGAGDPDADTLTNEQEETGGTDPTKADTDGDGWADGSDTVPLVADNVTQNVTFKVDMGVQIFKGAFVAGTDTLYVVGDFGPENIWNTTANLLTDLDSDGVYEGTVVVTSAGLANLGFKYLIGGKIPENSGYENGGNRTLMAAPAGTTPADRTLMTVPFANATATREVKFQVDVSVAQASGVFDPATDTVEVAGTFSNNFSTGYLMSAPDANGVCSLTTFLDGAENTAIKYKFRIKRGTEYNWESDPDRTFNLGPAYVVGGANSPQILTSDYFNRTSQSRSLTFKVDMGVQITKGLFADGDTLEIRYGNFNVVGKALVKEGSTTVYSATFVVPGNAGTALEYKYWKMNAATTTTTPFERVDVPRNNQNLNRTYTLGGNEVAVTISPTPYFSNDDGVGPVISLVGASTLNVNVGEAYVESGATATDAVEGTVTVIPSGAVDTSTAGTYVVTYNASDVNANAATPVTRTVVVVAPNPLAAYVGSFGLSGEDAAGDADPDGDGQNNSAEYAFGTDPKSSASRPITLISSTGEIKLVYLQRNTGVSYSVKSFTDLATSFDSGTTVTPVATSPQPENVRTGYTQYEAALSTAGIPKGFLRVQATLAP
jgi:hypothetical protein